MRHTLVLGAPVGRADHAFGKLSAILVDNGVANQIVVNPTGLFSGPERVVPLSSLGASTADQVVLDVTDDDWRAFGAFSMETLHVAALTAPHGLPVNPGIDLDRKMAELPTEQNVSTDPTVADTVVVLSKDTQVGTLGALHGLVIDTGIPEALLVGHQQLPFSQVGRLDSKQIELGATPHSDEPARSH